jgi:hypothetical protein
MNAVATIPVSRNGLTVKVEVSRPPPEAMTYSLNVNRIFAPDTAVVHRDEEYESGRFEAIRDMQSRHFWYQGLLNV